MCFRATQKRFHRLESHIVTLAKSVAHLSTEISTQTSIINEMDRISAELDIVKQQLNYQHTVPSNDTSAQPAPTPRLLPGELSNSNGETNPQKISKLTR